MRGIQARLNSAPTMLTPNASRLPSMFPDETSKPSPPPRMTKHTPMIAAMPPVTSRGVIRSRRKNGPNSAAKIGQGATFSSDAFASVVYLMEYMTAISVPSSRPSRAPPAAAASSRAYAQTCPPSASAGRRKNGRASAKRRKANDTGWNVSVPLRERPKFAPQIAADRQPISVHPSELLFSFMVSSPFQNEGFE